jgi:hypothetical protein
VHLLCDRRQALPNHRFRQQGALVTISRRFDTRHLETDFRKLAKQSASQQEKFGVSLNTTSRKTSHTRRTSGSPLTGGSLIRNSRAGVRTPVSSGPTLSATGSLTLLPVANALAFAMPVAPTDDLMLYCEHDVSFAGPTTARSDVCRSNAGLMLSWINGRPVPTDFGGPTDVPFEPFLPTWIDQPIIRRFQSIADRFADKVAIDDGNTPMTYRQVRVAVAAMAARIVEATPDGGAIAAILDNTSSFPVVFLACLMTGRPIIPVDATYPSAHQKTILQECGASAVVLGEGLALPDDMPDALVRNQLAVSGHAAPEAVEPAISRSVDDPAGVIYTSGSTGKPKGVAFSQRQFLASLSEYINACHIGPEDRLLGLASLGGASVREALAALLTGATFHIADLRQSGINAVFRTLKSAGGTVLAFVPSVLRSFTARPDAASTREPAHCRPVRRTRHGRCGGGTP